MPIALAMLIVIAWVYPIGADWQWTFSRAAQDFTNPYAASTFTNPPWTLLFLPHAWLGLKWGNAVNFILTVVVLGLIVRNHGWLAILLTFTSPLFLDLARTNNVDWIPALAFLIPRRWGLPLLAVKPQALGGAAVVWLKEMKWKALVPLVVVSFLSLVGWGPWPLKVNGPPDVHMWNFAPWPFLLPVGAYLLYRALREDDEILGAAATPFLVPYVAPYSLAPLLALVSTKYKKEAVFVYVAFWAYFVIESRRLGGLGPGG